MTQRDPAILNGLHVVRCPATKEEWVFRIKTQSPGARFRPRQRLIGLLTTKRDERWWQLIGIVTNEGIDLFRSRRDSAIGRIAEALWSLGTGSTDNAYELETQPACVICNQTLLGAIAMSKGIGPECEIKTMTKDPELGRKIKKVQRLRLQLEPEE